MTVPKAKCYKCNYEDDFDNFGKMIINLKSVFICQTCAEEINNLTAIEKADREDAL